MVQGLLGAALSLQVPLARASVCPSNEIVTQTQGAGFNTLPSAIDAQCVEFSTVVNQPSAGTVQLWGKPVLTQGLTMYMDTTGSPLTYGMGFPPFSTFPNATFNQSGYALSFQELDVGGVAAQATMVLDSTWSPAQAKDPTYIGPATELVITDTGNLDGGSVWLNDTYVAGPGLYPTLGFDNNLTFSAPLNLVGTGALDLRGHTITLTSNVSGQSGNTSSLVVQGGGTLDFQGQYNATGSLSVGQGTTFKLSSDNISSASDVIVNGTLDATALHGVLDVQSLGGTSTGELLAGSNTVWVTNGNDDFAGTLQGTSQLDILGGAQTLSGNNYMTGATQINAGATLLLAGNYTSAGSPIIVDGSLDISGMNHSLQVSSVAGVGNIALGTRDLVLDNASGTLSGVISGQGGLTVSAGTETLTGNSTYTGLTTIAPGGTLVLEGGGSFAIPSNLLDNGMLEFANGHRIWAASIAGSGGVAVTGGSATLSAVNTYQGPTSIGSGSTLNLTGSGSITASAVDDNGLLDISGTSAGASVMAIHGAGAVSLGSQTLTVTHASGTLSGPISGQGSLVVAGGNQTLGAQNSYTGSTTIDSSATLTLSGSATVSSSLTDNGTLAFSNPGQPFSVLIAGAGGVHAISGATTLTAANTYAGTTEIDSGATLGLGSSGSVGAGVVVDNGMLDISSHGSDVTLASLQGSGGVHLGARSLSLAHAVGMLGGVISGSGGLTVAAGTQALQGAETYTGPTTVAAGAALIVGPGGSLATSALLDDGGVDIAGSAQALALRTLSGTGSLSLGANALTLSDASGVFSGDIAGTASVTLQAGSETFGGVDSYTGGTTVRGGALTLADGSALGSGLQVQQGASTLAAGAVRIAGDVVNAGTLGVGSAARPQAVLAVGGSYTQQASGILNETITAASNTMLQVQGPQLDLGGELRVQAVPGPYLRKTYLLVSAPAATRLNGRFSSWEVLGLSPSDYSFALDYVADPQVLLTVTALHPFDPGPHGSPNQRQVSHLLDTVGGSSTGALYQRLTDILGAGSVAAALDRLDGQLYSQTPSWLLQGTLREWGRLFQRIDLGRQAGAARHRQAFAYLDASQGHVLGDGNADGVSMSSSGLTLGRQLRRGAWRLGLGVGTLNLGATRHGAGDGMMATLYRFGVFAARRLHGVRVGSVLGFTAGQVGYGQAARDVGVWTWQTRAAHDFAVSPSDVLTPLLSLDLQHMHLGGATESDPVLGLQVPRQTVDTLSSLAALREVHGWQWGSVRGEISASVGVRHWWRRPPASMRLAFDGIAGYTFSNWGVAAPRNLLQATLGMHARLRRDLSAQLAWQGDYGRALRANELELHLTWRF